MILKGWMRGKYAGVPEGKKKMKDNSIFRYRESRCFSQI